MRGPDISQKELFITSTVEDFVPETHPLRETRELIDRVLKELDQDFDRMYAEYGRASIPPERLIRASFLQIFYTIRSERRLVEEIRYNLLYRWFVGLELGDDVWNHSTFSKNRDRLMEHNIIVKLFEKVLSIAQENGLVSDEHFSVDGTLLEAWASHKSFKPKDEDGDDDPGDGTNFHGQKRSNKTHESTTDPEAKLARKSAGKEAKLSYGVHVINENRNGLVVATSIAPVVGTGEREEAIELMKTLPGDHRKTMGADKGYDTRHYVKSCRELNVTPHSAQNTKRKGGSAIDERTTRHPGYEISQNKRKLIETIFGWTKQYGGLRRMMYRGLDRVGERVILSLTAFNLMRTRNILAMESGL